MSAASEIGRDWHLGYKYGSQIDAEVMIPMMENIFLGNDVTSEVENATAKLTDLVNQ